MPNKKQSTLNFGSSKRSSAGVAKNSRLSQNVMKQAPSELHSLDHIEEKGSREVPVPQKRKRAEHQLEVEENEPTIQSLSEERPELKVNDPRWCKLAAKARAENGNLPLIHAERENKIHDILRVFDLTYEYGPCYGISRIDRWERANAIGLDPPTEIRDILLTQQGTEDAKYAQSVFFDPS